MRYRPGAYTGAARAGAPGRIREAAGGTLFLPAALRAQARLSVQQAMQDCAGNLSEAARRLGISRNTLYRKLREQ